MRGFASEREGALLKFGRHAAIGLIAAVLVLAASLAASAQDPREPTITRIQADWDAVATELKAATADQSPDLIANLNRAVADIFPNAAASPVPVLLPFDTPAYLRDRAAETPRSASDYFSGFRLTPFFLAGPGGYDAVLTASRQDMPDLDLNFGLPIAVHISGTALVYELDEPAGMVQLPVNGIGADYPGIRRMFLEGYLRYAFVRDGVPYVLAIDCSQGRAREHKPSCRDADKVALRALKELQVVGGTPSQQSPVVALPTIERPAAISTVFTYHPSGDLIPGTGMHGNGGRTDTTVYSKIRFPLADAPAFANSQSFNSYGICDATGRVSAGMRGKVPAYRCRVSGQVLVADESAAENYSYPWRDNFCEHRYFSVSQCPGGLGHQGQDIRPASCRVRNDNATRCEPYQHDTVAVRNAMVMRLAGQMSVYLVVNEPNERIRFRYLHMNPKLLDANGVSSGRTVHEGEVIGQVGTFDRREGGTTYHLHFDIQVPTRYGWVFVNPYMTLVTAYERLIRARGQEVTDPPEPPVASTAAAEPQNALQVAPDDRIEPPVESHARHAHRYFPPHAAARRWRRLSARFRRAGGFRTRHAYLR